MRRPEAKQNAEEECKSALATPLSAKSTLHRETQGNSEARTVTVTFASLFASAQSLEASGLVVAALALLESALRKSQLGISSTEHAHLLVYTARTYRMYTDNINEPKNHASKAIQVLDRIGNSNKARSLLAQAQIILAECCHAQGLQVQAQSALSEAMQHARDTNSVALLSWVLLQKLEMFEKLEDRSSALSCLEDAREQSNDPKSFCATLCSLYQAHFYLRSGDVMAAEKALQSIQTCRAQADTGDFVMLKASSVEAFSEYRDVLRRLCSPSGTTSEVKPLFAEIPTENALAQCTFPSTSQATGQDIQHPTQICVVTTSKELSGFLRDGKVASNTVEGSTSSYTSDEQDCGFVLLNLERAVRNSLTNNNFLQAQTQLVQMVQEIKAIGSEQVASTVRSEAQTKTANMQDLCLCLAAEYLHRIGRVTEACEYLRRLEGAAATDCKLWAHTYQALIFLESESVEPEAVERLNQKSVELCAANIATPIQRAALLHNQAKLVLRLSFGRADQVATAKWLLSEALQVVQDCEDGLMLQAWIACSYSETLLQEHPPAIDEALFYLCRTHVKVHASGDRWLELKVLRGLERGYLAAPNQSSIARASLDIKESKRRAYEKAVAAMCRNEITATLGLNSRAAASGMNSLQSRAAAAEQKPEQAILLDLPFRRMTEQ